MKSKLSSMFLTLIIFSTPFLPNTFAQDYTQLNLPEGAKARLGKGTIIDMQLSPDNNRLVISTSAGIWLYDVSIKTQKVPLIKFGQQYASHIAFSPDSKTLALSAYDKTIRLWNTDNGVNRLKFDTPDGPFKSLKFSPDGKTLIGQNWQGAIWLWDTTNGEQLIAFNPNLPKLNPRKYKNWNLAADFYVDHTGDIIIAVGNKDGTISIRNGKTNREIRKLTSSTDDSPSLPIQYLRPFSPDPDVWDGGPYIKWVNTLYFAPDGKTLVSKADYRRARWDGWEGQGGPLELWDVSTGEQLAVLQWRLNISFSGDGKTFAISEGSDHVLWDIPSRRKIAEFQDVKIRFSGDGKTLAIIDSSGYKIWDITTQRETVKHSQLIEWLETSPERFVLSHDGTILATADRNGILALWETQNTKQLRCLLTGYTYPFTALAFSHDNKTLASGDVAGNIRLWDLNSGSKRSTIKTKSIENLVFTKDDATLISEGKISKSESNIEVWNVLTGEQIDVFTAPNTSRNDYYIGFGDGTALSIHHTSMFSPNGEKLAIETKGGIEIWDVPIHKHLNTLTQVRSRFNAWAFTPDGKILAVNMGSAVRLWNTQTGKHFTLKILKGWRNKLLEAFRLLEFRIYALAFASDGKTLAAGGQDKKIYLWDISTKRHITTLKHEYAVSKLAFSPDGKILASGDTSGKIHLWEFATGHLLTMYNGHGNYISGLSFTPDGKTLASVSGGSGSFGYNSGTILLWDMPSK
ncbi:hypothetical protein C6501_14230 [Candidatus Poribacteria bacterium]|nr:MAG: hypothetical protein C6501_14230 [Candidatus Poribacteria bacterium]